MLSYCQQLFQWIREQIQLGKQQELTILVCSSPVSIIFIFSSWLQQGPLLAEERDEYRNQIKRTLKKLCYMTYCLNPVNIDALDYR